MGNGVYVFPFFLAALGLGCCAEAFSRCGGSRLLFIMVQRLLLCRAQTLGPGAHLCGTQALGLGGFVKHREWAQQVWLSSSRAVAQQLWRMGLIAPQQTESSCIRDRTRVPCISKWILTHCTTRKAQEWYLEIKIIKIWVLGVFLATWMSLPFQQSYKYLCIYIYIFIYIHTYTMIWIFESPPQIHGLKF